MVTLKLPLAFISNSPRCNLKNDWSVWCVSTQFCTKEAERTFCIVSKMRSGLRSRQHWNVEVIEWFEISLFANVIILISVVRACRGRWKSLRDRFHQEYRKLNTLASENNVDVSEIKSRWRYYGFLSFLHEYEKTPRKYEYTTSLMLVNNIKDFFYSSTIPCAELSERTQSKHHTDDLPGADDTSSSPTQEPAFCFVDPIKQEPSFTEPFHQNRRQSEPNVDEMFSTFLKTAKGIIANNSTRNHQCDESSLFYLLIDEKLSMLSRDERMLMETSILQQINTRLGHIENTKWRIHSRTVIC